MTCISGHSKTNALTESTEWPADDECMQHAQLVMRSIVSSTRSMWQPLTLLSKVAPALRTTRYSDTLLMSMPGALPIGSERHVSRVIVMTSQHGLAVPVMQTLVRLAAHAQHKSKGAILAFGTTPLCMMLWFAATRSHMHAADMHAAESHCHARHPLLQKQSA